jgi:hypothetical protein
MLAWIDSHGFIVLGAYMALVFIAGTVPPLPAGASFWEQWGYMLLKAVALNSRAVGNSMGIKLPELQMPSTRRASEAQTDESSKGQIAQ